MKRIFLLQVTIVSFLFSLAQRGEYIRPTSLGISFVLMDYTSAERLRNTSLTTVIRNKELGKFKEMSPGIALNYYQGIFENIDFTGTLAGAFVDIPLQGRNSGSSDKFLLEADASAHLKLLSDRYFFTPYLNLGLGASMYDKSFGAFLPLGLGLKFNFFNEAALHINSQYRVALTEETNAYHFFNSIGIAGIIGKKREPAVRPVEIPQQ